MSFDLAVWSDMRRSVKNASEIYEALCDGGDTRVLKPAADSASSIQAFLGDLTAKYPAMDTFADDDIDNCVWSSEFESSDVHVLMSMSSSCANEVAPSVARLAETYGLILYNPQVNAVRLPHRQIRMSQSEPKCPAKSV